jgi:predicted nucleic acid-binding protein
MVVIMQVTALDTNIFIYYFQKHPEFGPFVKPLFESILASEIKAVTSIIAITELLSLKAPQEDVDRLRTLFLEIPNLRTVDVNERIALDAAHIRRSYGFRLPDSIQLATAIYAKAEIFITNDKRLSGYDGIQIKMLS